MEANTGEVLVTSYIKNPNELFGQSNPLFVARMPHLTQQSPDFSSSHRREKIRDRKIPSSKLAHLTGRNFNHATFCDF